MMVIMSVCVGVARRTGAVVGVGVDPSPLPGVPHTLMAGPPVGVGVGVSGRGVRVGVARGCGDGSGVAVPGAGKMAPARLMWMVAVSCLEMPSRLVAQASTS